MRSTKRFDPGPETALGHPVLSNFYLEWQAMYSQKKSQLFHQARFLIFKTKTKPVLASGPEHPYEVQERSRVRNRDAEGCSNNTAAMKSEDQCETLEENNAISWSRGSNWQIQQDFCDPSLSSQHLHPLSRARFMHALVPTLLTSLCWGQMQELWVVPSPCPC